jgi:hypothetical protein
MANADRLALVRLIGEVKQGPANNGMAIVSASALTTERTPHRLASERAANAKAFLVQMGIDPSRIAIAPATIHPPSPTPEDYHLEIQFVPVCPPEGCDSLCGTPNPEKPL